MALSKENQKSLELWNSYCDARCACDALGRHLSTCNLTQARDALIADAAVPRMARELEAVAQDNVDDKQANDNLRAERDRYMGWYYTSVNKGEKLADDLRVALEALEFYADKKHYAMGTNQWAIPVYNEHGDKARATIGRLDKENHAADTDKRS